MSYLNAIILGIVQGLTEFLPVSSSGHLVLAEHFLNAKMPGVDFELVLHMGTLLSVLIYFRKQIFGLIKALYSPAMIEERKMILYLILGTIPAGLAGFFLKDIFEEAFSSPVATSIFMLITGVILLSTAVVKAGERKITWGRSLLIGVGQAVAIFPGISRSGTTISTGLFLRVKPIIAAEYSFLLSIPAILGAIVLKSREIASLNTVLMGPYLIGAIVSFIFGLMAVYLLLDIIRRGKFKYFGIYCLVMGAVALIHFL
ncbi:Undecaprenyl-diphosphatase [Candidatus Zixiibacteriota bacterium]|nr:Undecaprenyl-diphosphatase [candidate division Zixibacteria bacterium]